MSWNTISKGTAGTISAVAMMIFPFAATYAQDGAEPERDVEILVTVGPGTGPDQLARQLQSIWRSEGFIDQPVTVVNRPGGGGAVGLSYLNNQAGDHHHVAIAGASMVTNHLAGRSPIGCEDVTPLGHLISEYIAIAVHPDSPLESAEQLFEELKENPSAYSIGIATSRGNSNHQAIALPASEHGIDVSALRTVVFQAGSEARTAVLGGHVDIVPASVGSLIGEYERGQLRLLAVSSGERMEGPMADVPTWRDLGFDIVVSNWRGIIGPRDLDDAQIAFWEDILMRTMEVESFRQSIDQAYQSAEWMTGEEFRSLCAREGATLSQALGQMGIE